MGEMTTVSCELLKVTNDPLDNLVPDVMEFIFQHLSWDELILISEINSLWYKTIGESSHCMARVKINIQNVSHLTNHNDLQTALPYSDCLIHSRRQYRNIYIDYLQQHKGEALIKFLSSILRKWKNVEILNAKFEDSTFLKDFNETVESMSLIRISCGANDRINKTLFPRLKCLKVFSCNKRLIEAVEECSTLSRLQISESEKVESKARSSKNLLLTNEKLETLIVLVNSYSTFFPTQVVVNIRFQLKKLVVDSWKDFSSQVDRECLKHLLKSQARSLKVVDINPWNGIDVLITCFTIPNLTDFTFNVKTREENIDWKIINFARNPSLKRIHVRNASKQESFDFYNAIFTAAPNLQVYKAKFMHFEDLNSLSSLCQHLEELYIDMFNVQFLPDENCLPKLKCFSSWDINDQLLRTLRNKSAKNKFEKLLTKL